VNPKRSLLILFTSLFLLAPAANAQIPGQLAHDFVAGTAPSPEEVSKLEKEVAANPTDARLVRKLGKAYFFQFFDEGDRPAVPKSEKTLERSLTLAKDDPEALAYLGALHILRAMRLEKGNAAKQNASYQKGFELIKKAEGLDPRNGAVMSVASASYLWLPDSYGMAPHVIEIVEGMRAAMGPMFKKFHHHGQQRLLLTLGQAYVKVGKADKALPLFEEALAVNGTSREAVLLRAELSKLKK
jgi:tetratricopeptide (TPR) repeat protein